MKKTIEWKKKIMAMTFVGAAAAILVSVPFADASAADVPPAPPAYTQQGSGPAMMPPQGQGFHHPKMAFSHRIQDMVREGKITDQQALDLNKEMDKFEKNKRKANEKFHEAQRKEHQKFIDSLPSKTGISETTLKEIFTPPARPDNDRRDGHDRQPRK